VLLCIEDTAGLQRCSDPTSAPSLGALFRFVCTPLIFQRSYSAFGCERLGDIKEADVRKALERLDPLWNERFPAEQTCIVHLLVERVDVSQDYVEIRLRTEGLANLVADLRAVNPEPRRATDSHVGSGQAHPRRSR
jgi:hypothetical protein